MLKFRFKKMDLTDVQWELLKPLLDKEQVGKGRPRVPAREVLSGVLWILRTGAPWKDLPDRYPPYQTCHRRYQEWVDEGKLDEVLSLLANDLKERGEIDVTECFIDGSFAPSKRGAQVLGKLSGARARRSWQLQTLLVFQSPSTRMKLTDTRSN